MDTLSRLRSDSATISALISDSGATNESTKEAMSLRAVRHRSETSPRGESGVSVMESTRAPRSLAKRMASIVRRE